MWLITHYPRTGLRSQLYLWQTSAPGPQQLHPVFRRRLAEDPFEHPVKVREGLESHFERNFAHAQIRIEQEILISQSDPRM
jgi:hypothetical protein